VNLRTVLLSEVRISLFWYVCWWD